MQTMSTSRWEMWVYFWIGRMTSSIPSKISNEKYSREGPIVILSTHRLLMLRDDPDHVALVGQGHDGKSPKRPNLSAPRS